WTPTWGPSGGRPTASTSGGGCASPRITSGSAWRTAPELCTVVRVRTRTTVLAAACALLALAPSAGAANLLDTLTVDPGSSSFAVGKTTLEPGTRYSMDISGTFQETGPEGYGFKYDGLYC